MGETLAVGDAGGAPLAEAGPPSAAGISVQNGEPNTRTPIWISRREQSALILAGLLLLANSPREHMIEWSLEGSPQNTDLTMPRFQMVDGDVEVPSAPGLGINLDRNVVERYRVR